MKEKLKMKNYFAGIILITLLLVICTVGAIVLHNQNVFSQTNKEAMLATTADITDTTNLKFTLYTNTDTGKSEYKVLTLNRNITEVEIPELYNDIPVTEVADNAFANCKQLTYVLVPSSIKRIGNNAFTNCTRLEKISGMTNVTILGNYVFNNCSALKNLILPAKLQYVGTSIIKNVGNTTYSRRSANELYAMNSTWDLNRSESGQIIFGNQLVYKDVIIDGVAGYSVEMYQSISTQDDIVLYSSALDPVTKKYKPILNVNKMAFADCEFGNFTIKHDDTLSFDHSININSNAFYGVTAKNISIETDITLNDETEQDPTWLDGENGMSVGVFEWTIVDTITLPSTLNRITRSMFSFSSVSEIKSTDSTVALNHLTKAITRIDTSAFEATHNIQNLYLPSTVAIMGDSVFNMWGEGATYDKQTIFIDMSTTPNDWADNWDAGINLGNSEIKFETTKTSYEITFDKQDGINGSDSVEAEYGKEMPIATAPTRENYVFQGYFSGKNGSGIKYYNADMTGTITWDKQTSATLYAYWTGVESTITFDKQGGANGSSTIVAEYGSPMPNAIAPKYTNYIFQGYYSEVNGSGIKYYDADMNSVINWDQATDIILYAYWKGIPCAVTLDMQGGDGGTTNIISEYGQSMPAAIAPTRENYVFQGYFSEPNGAGDKYYDANMNSITEWDQTTATTLYAHWKGIEVTYIFDKLGGSDGTNFVTVEYGQLLPPAIAPIKKGYFFAGYYTGPDRIGIQYYDRYMNCNIKCSETKNTTLYAYWINNKYTINFDSQGGMGGTSSIKVDFNENLPNIISPTRKGYKFEGYYTDIDGKGVKYYKEDMTSARKWDINDDATLYAYWSLGKYKVTIDTQGGYLIGDNFFYATYSEPMPTDFSYFSKQGYCNAGLSTSPNGEGKNYYNFIYKTNLNLEELADVESLATCDFTNDIILYAHYQPRIYDFSIYYIGIGPNGERNNIAKTEYFSLEYNHLIFKVAPDINGYTYNYTDRNCYLYTPDERYTTEKSFKIEPYNSEYKHFSYTLYYKQNECLAEGSLITLADGSQVPVEQLTGNELLLVWNLKTGSFDTAPILFIDHDARKNYEVINLQFSDGTTVKVISEHAFWDFDLNKYVFLRKDAAQYIGHAFNKQITDNKGNLIWTKVQLINVEVREEYTSSWSPVTYGHLCYYVNGMLSMPGATQGLINIFDVNQETMQYEQETFQTDIDKYGLYSYEEFDEIYKVSEKVFFAINGEYLKISIGKGLITREIIELLIRRYIVLI